MIDNILSTINKTKDYFTDLVIANFNESLSLFSDLERNISGQTVVPSPAKTKTTMAPTKGRQPTKLDPAPRDTSASWSVSYPQNKEGSLNILLGSVASGVKVVGISGGASPGGM